MPTFEEALRALREHSIVRGFDVNLAEHVATLYLAPTHHADMTAVIAMFEAIDGNVRWIDIWSGREPDTAYRLVSGQWQAVVPEPADAAGLGLGE